MPVASAMASGDTRIGASKRSTALLGDADRSVSPANVHSEAASPVRAITRLARSGEQGEAQTKQERVCLDRTIPAQDCVERMAVMSSAFRMLLRPRRFMLRAMS